LGFDDTRTLMRELDRDGDGRMNYREFVQFLKSSGSGSGAGGVGGEKEKTPSRPTTAASSSKAVSISVSDRVATELRTKFDAAIDSGKIRSYEDVFRAMDKDGDGTVSKAEFEDGLRDLRVCCWSDGVSIVARGHRRAEWTHAVSACRECRCDWASTTRGR
jgi:hypothetical protein